MGRNGNTPTSAARGRRRENKPVSRRPCQYFRSLRLADGIEKPGVVLQLVADFQKCLKQCIAPPGDLGAGQRLQEAASQFDRAKVCCAKLLPELVPVVLP